jgi:hypothetical protein
VRSLVRGRRSGDWIPLRRGSQTSVAKPLKERRDPKWLASATIAPIGSVIKNRERIPSRSAAGHCLFILPCKRFNRRCENQLQSGAPPATPPWEIGGAFYMRGRGDECGDSWVARAESSDPAGVPDQESDASFVGGTTKPYTVRCGAALGTRRIGSRAGVTRSSESSRAPPSDRRCGVCGDRVPDPLGIPIRTPWVRLWGGDGKPVSGARGLDVGALHARIIAACGHALHLFGVRVIGGAPFESRPAPTGSSAPSGIARSRSCA